MMKQIAFLHPNMVSFTPLSKLQEGGEGRMSWAQPQYSRGQVDKAGRVLAGQEAGNAAETAALYVLDNWRASHNFPLNTFQVGLRNRARKIDGNALVAQRLKRVPSIVRKLQRFPSMSLSRMQDLGGCRAVLTTATQVAELRDIYLKSDIKHILVNQKDYIQNPKDSGYRGIHLVYKYRSDKNGTYNNHQIEVQLRSRLQHSWATAVETVGTLLSQSLKASEGEGEWLDFFAWTSSAFSYIENTPPLAGMGSRSDVYGRVRDMANGLQVISKLTNYGHALHTIEEASDRDSHYFLMVLRPSHSELRITGYHRTMLEKATGDYLIAEQQVAEEVGSEAVLVTAESLNALRTAYPNYFLDTQRFVTTLGAIVRNADR
ncbi:RelA/SpoT domain-containing protein [Cupriavidus sp. USMAHM13]|uniref:RelA/SpoT domain-containing protein n=1 Tax=Cupriavidus sp. USMAHM13 TaxID=1389192 RepID=UPI0009F60546|nr:RelA/SpoT domain-containing protein [Cupriavidus sp. USMAHM13]